MNLGMKNIIRLNWKLYNINARWKLCVWKMCVRKKCEKNGVFVIFAELDVKDTLFTLCLSTLGSKVSSVGKKVSTFASHDTHDRSIRSSGISYESKL